MNDVYLAYFLLAVGLLLMAGELMLPTGGILFVLGIGALIASVAMLFSYDAAQALVTLVALFVVLPATGTVLLRYWPRSVFGRHMVLHPNRDDDASVAGMPVHLELEGLRGHYGKTVSALRPSGKAEFDGRRVDTISEGPLIEAGQWVRCIDVRATQVIVRQVDAPPELGDMDLSSLDS